MRTVPLRYSLLACALLSLAAWSKGESAAAGPQPPTLEALKTAAAEEFDAAAKSMRERLEQAQAHDAVGEAVATHALQLHRSRYLDLKRAIETRLPEAPSEADRRSPFVPDFKALPAAAPIPRTLVRGGDWDLYSRQSPNPVSIPAAKSWGMYGRAGLLHGEPPAQSALSEPTKASAAQPVLVYRTSAISSAAKEEVSGFERLRIHTTEERQ